MTKDSTERKVALLTNGVNILFFEEDGKWKDVRRIHLEPKNNNEVGIYFPPFLAFAGEECEMEPLDKDKYLCIYEPEEKLLEAYRQWMQGQGKKIVEPSAKEKIAVLKNHKNH